MEDKNINKKKILGVILILAIVGVLTLIALLIWYNVSLSPKSKNSEEVIDVEIEEGMGISSISELLEEKNVIKSAIAMKIHSKLNKVGSLKAGNYKLNPALGTKEIVNQIREGKVYYTDFRITFIEGRSIRKVAETIAKETNNTENDVYALLKNEEYIDSLIDKYWFITDEIKNKNIYYPLEGYLLPDTYSFDNEDVSVEKIFEVMLGYLDKYLTENKEKIENNPYNLTVHQLLTMASMTELEGKTTEDRKEIIGVFFNRIDKRMNLGSDVTTYYAFKVDMGDRDLTAKELNTENPYNTRGPNMAGKIPIGPICNPSKSSIEATIDYTETDSLYFVADKNGKVYFTKNNDEHLRMIKKLKNQGLWYVYE